MKTKPLARCGREGETRVPTASQAPHPLLRISLTRVPYSPPPFPALTRSLPSSSPHLPSRKLLQLPHSLFPPFQSNLSTRTNQSALSQLPSLKRIQGRQGHTCPRVKAVKSTAKMLVKSLSLSLSLFQFHTELLSLYLLNVKCMNARSFCQVLIWWQIPAQPRDITFLAPAYLCGAPAATLTEPAHILGWELGQALSVSSLEVGVASPVLNGTPETRRPACPVCAGLWKERLRNQLGLFWPPCSFLANSKFFLPLSSSLSGKSPSVLALFQGKTEISW